MIDTFENTKLPQYVLANSIKVVYDPPIGAKQEMHRLFSEMNTQKLEDCTKHKPWKKLVFSLTLFHSVVVDRRRYHAWQHPYFFTDSSYEVMLHFLRQSIEQEQPLENLNSLIGEVIYGYCVASEYDRRTIQCLADRFCNENVLLDDYVFVESLPYKSVASGNHMWYMEMINRLPDQE